MRLINVNNELILNLDKIAVINGKPNCGDKGVSVYADDNYIGKCENKEDFRLFVERLCDAVAIKWPEDTICDMGSNDIDEELWT